MHPIGLAAKRTGLKIPTIRFYEQEGLIGAPERSKSGRRLYSDGEVHRLAFIKHARTLGFELDDIRSLLDLADHPDRSCADADRIARRHLAEIEQRLAQLSVLKAELTRIIKSCAGGKAAQCRVIEALADHVDCGTDHAPAQPTKNRLPRLRRAPPAKRRRT